MSSELEADGIVWQRRPLEDLVWTEFDDDYVVYHRPSGKTHLLNAASLALIEDVLSEPSGLADIAVIFAPEGTGAEEDGYRARLATMLQRLEHLGLVERV